MAKREITLPLFLNNQAGFTLMEVMIALVIFAVFSTAFVTSQGYNLIDSSKLKEEMLLKDYCENKMNEIVVDPPKLNESLTLSKETKDVEANTEYQTTVEFKKFIVPDMSKIASEGEEQESAQSQMEKKIFKVFKENMEKMIWQVEVTARNKLSNSSFKLSTWLYNQNADVQIGAF
jgi:type II secretion system protein I